MIPIAKPSFGEEEEIEVIKVLRSGWVSQGPKVQEFEQLFADYILKRGALLSNESNKLHAIAVSSGTTALHASLLSLGLKPGDEVIVPGFTWVATANTVEQTGAIPIFVDINIDTFNIDETQICQKITSRTVGIVPVHQFGNPCNIQEILRIAKEHNLWVLEDAACSMGAAVGHAHVGQFGSLACFSFHPRKMLTTGEGGMIITFDSGLAERCRSLRNHGATFDKTTKYMADFPMCGYNYRLSDILAAVGCVQMKKAGEFLNERIHLANLYVQYISETHLNPYLQLPATMENNKHSYQAFVVLLKEGHAARHSDSLIESLGCLAKKRDSIIDHLSSHGICVRPGTHAPPLLSYYSKKYGLSPQQFVSSAIAEAGTIALPLYNGMAQSDVLRVVQVLSNYFESPLKE